MTPPAIPAAPPATGPGTDTLTALRARLDAADAALLDAVRTRLDICLRIGEYKRLHQVPMMQPHRIAQVHANAARYAADHGIDPAFLRTLYDTIITETCRLEDEWIASGGTPAHAPAPAQGAAS
ncbi:MULTISPECIES: chorismate mutase family protein [unclassified Streptomyces]|uniref:chorismate mutase family protein n=1 Tax=unclassified Streptomyces TaxID=2593676 RepID=UPI002787AF21|nr:chorismate mutase family protein [Streptomyces sp. V1I6]MDQ0847805.1 chorismate mutase-like protein [Streptomyces sp. V1I6]